MAHHVSEYVSCPAWVPTKGVFSSHTQSSCGDADQEKAANEDKWVNLFYKNQTGTGYKASIQNSDISVLYRKLEEFDRNYHKQYQTDHVYIHIKNKDLYKWTYFLYDFWRFYYF